MSDENLQDRLTRLARMGDLVMKVVEDEGRDGEPPRSISFVGIEFKPLGYRELADARLHLPVTVPLDWSNARVLETDVPGVNIDGYAQGKATLESIFSSTTVSLQRGGWLPSGLAVSRHGVTVILDRNVFGRIKSRYEGGTVLASDGDFLDVLNDLDVRINPLLFAMEGNGRGIPSPAVVQAQLDEAVELICRALPNATLTVGDGSMAGALGMLEDSRPDLERKQAFLLEVAPSLASPTSHRLMAARWSEALAAADRHGVPRTALVVLAVLSAIVVPNSASPAKKLLKFKPGYGAGDAYNSLADLRSLEILIQLNALFPDERPALFTADKALALFWVGIRADSFQGSTGSPMYDLSPVEELLPGDTLASWRSVVAGHKGGGGRFSPAEA